MELSQKDRSYIWHPFTQMKTAPPPIPIVRGEGIYLYSEDGRKYIDAISSWWVNLHGHAHPYIIEKIYSQAKELEHVMFAGFTHAPAVDLAERLLPLLPGAMTKIFYSDNGSTAVETALKMALQYWHNKNIPKNKVLCLKNSYHGDTFGAMSAAGKNRFNAPFQKYLFDVIQIEPSSLDPLEDENIACFIFEPLVLAAGGMILYSAADLNRLMKWCRERGILLIADEVMTGFGRTGPLFACEYIEEKPDIICLSKGITGGFLPLGVTACKEEIFEAFFDKALLHGHSYTANPLACASALASLDLLTQSNRERISVCHKAFCQKWSGHPRLKRCESLGTLLVLEYYEIPDVHFFISKGIFLRPLGNVLYVLPPYCIQEEELQYIYECIGETL